MKFPTLALFVLLCFGAHAQTWQWAKSGGSSAFDRTLDITISASGRLYVINNISTGGNPMLYGHTINGFGGRDVALTAFSCDGTYLWSKIIGSGGDDLASSVLTDNNGNVYVDMDFAYGVFTAHIGNDTVFQSTLAARDYLVSFDSMGNYRWARTPVTTLKTNGVAGVYPTDLTLDKDGNIAWLCNMSDSMIIHDVNDTTLLPRYVLLTYSPAGAITKATTIDLYSDFMRSLQMAFTKNDNRIIMSASGFIGTTFTGNIGLNHCGFVLCFDRQGQLLWSKQNGDLNSSGSGFPCKPVVDTLNNIYLGGAMLINDTFNGTYINYTAGGKVPFVTKIDTNGHKIWAVYGIDSFGTSSTFGSLAMRNPFELVIAGNYAGSFNWPGRPTERFNTNSGNSNGFITRLNAATGEVLHTDTIAHPIDNTVSIGSIVSNGEGTIYATGNFDDSIMIAGNILHGSQDFFIASDGFPGCACTLPNVNFSMDIYTHPDSIVLTFPASAQADSFIWEFGTGTFSVLPNVSYTYINGFQNYKVCLTAWNACGFNIACKDLSHVNINETGVSYARIYPNPADDLLVIDMQPGMPVCTYSISNITGRQVLDGRVYSGTNTVSLAELPPGMYFLILDNAGEKSTAKILRR